MIKLGYSPKQKFKWKELPKDYKKKEFNKKLVVTINQRLWEKVKNIVYIRKKGFDTILLIDGGKRKGKSTIAMTIAYLLNPNLAINNYVAGLEEAPDKIDIAKDEDVLIFDEGSLVASSKDVMTKKNKQLLKIIDVVGQKRLTLIFCMPSFFEIAKQIAISHSLFLIHVYTDDRLNRGRFAYFSTKRKKVLYIIGKKNHGSYSKPKADWTGTFSDFHLPFEEEYFKLKKESLKEALNPEAKKDKPKQLTEKEIRIQVFRDMRNKLPEFTVEKLSEIFEINRATGFRWLSNKNNILEKPILSRSRTSRTL